MSNIKNVVEKVMALYLREDYDYVVEIVKEGRSVSSTNPLTVESEIEFIKRNGLAPAGMTEEEIRSAAKQCLAQIQEVNEHIEDRYSVRSEEDKGNTLRAKIEKVLGSITEEQWQVTRKELVELATKEPSQSEIREARGSFGGDNFRDDLIIFEILDNRLYNELSILRKYKGDMSDRDDIIDLRMDTLTTCALFIREVNGKRDSFKRVSGWVLELL